MQNSRKIGKHRTRNPPKKKIRRKKNTMNLMNFMGVRQADPGGQKKQSG
jgi:hypothetical protein